MQAKTHLIQYAFDKGLNLLQRTAASGQTRMIAAAHSNRAINSELYSSLGLSPTQEASLNQTFIDENIFDQGGNQLKSVVSSGLGWDYRSMLVNTETDRKNAAGAKVGELNEYNLYAKTGKRSRKITEKTDVSGNITEIQEALYLGNLEYRSTWVGDNLEYNGEVVTENDMTKSPQEAYVALRIRQGHKAVSEKRAYTFKDGSLVSEVASFFSLDNNIDSCELKLNNKGSLESYYSSKPYGETAVSYGKVKLHPYKYSGQEKDQSGLYYYGYRSLLPQNFRWMSADPAGLQGSGLNWYAMVNGNPVTHQDLYGLGLFDILMAGIMMVGALSNGHQPLNGRVEAFNGRIIGALNDEGRSSWTETSEQTRFENIRYGHLRGVLVAYDIVVEDQYVSNEVTFVEKVSITGKQDNVNKLPRKQKGTGMALNANQDSGFFPMVVPLDKGGYKYDKNHFAFAQRDRYTTRTILHPDVDWVTKGQSGTQRQVAWFQPRQQYYIYNGALPDNLSYADYEKLIVDGTLALLKNADVRVDMFVERDTKTNDRKVKWRFEQFDDQGNRIAWLAVDAHSHDKAVDRSKRNKLFYFPDPIGFTRQSRDEQLKREKHVRSSAFEKTGMPFKLKTTPPSPSPSGHIPPPKKEL